MKSDEFRALLKSCGLSQRKLAGLLGVAVSTVNHWATGKMPVAQYAVAYLELVKRVKDLTDSVGD